MEPFITIDLSGTRTQRETYYIDKQIYNCNQEPHIDSKYDTGSLTKQWENVYARNLWKNGVEVASLTELHEYVTAVAPLNMTNGQVSLLTDNTLKLTGNELSVDWTKLPVTNPLFINGSNNSLDLSHDSSLQVNGTSLAVAWENAPLEAGLVYNTTDHAIKLQTSEPLFINTSDSLALSHDTSLLVNGSNELSVNFADLPLHTPLTYDNGVGVSLAQPLFVDSTGTIDILGLGAYGIETVTDANGDKNLAAKPDGWSIILAEDDEPFNINIKKGALFVEPASFLFTGHGLQQVDDPLLSHSLTFSIKLASNSSLTCDSNGLKLTNPGSTYVPFWTVTGLGYDSTYNYNQGLSKLSVGNVTATGLIEANTMKVTTAPAATTDVVNKGYLDGYFDTSYFQVDGTTQKLQWKITQAFPIAINNNQVSLLYDQDLFSILQDGTHELTLKYDSTYFKKDATLGLQLNWTQAFPIALTNNQVSLLYDQSVFSILQDGTHELTLTYDTTQFTTTNNKLQIKTPTHQIAFGDSAGLLTSNSGFYFDPSVNTLTVPDVSSSGIISGANVRVTNSPSVGTDCVNLSSLGTHVAAGSHMTRTVDSSGVVTLACSLTAGTGLSLSGDTLAINLSANNGVSISGNTISGAYTGSNGVSVSGGTISGSYVGGNSIKITGNTISFSGYNNTDPSTGGTANAAVQDALAAVIGAGSGVVGGAAGAAVLGGIFDGLGSLVSGLAGGAVAMIGAGAGAIAGLGAGALTSYLIGSAAGQNSSNKLSNDGIAIGKPGRTDFIVSVNATGDALAVYTREDWSSPNLYEMINAKYMLEGCNVGHSYSGVQGLGVAMNVNTMTFSDDVTSAFGTSNEFALVKMSQPTINWIAPPGVYFTTPSVATPRGSTLFIEGPPLSTTANHLDTSNSYSLYVASGQSNIPQITNQCTFSNGLISLSHVTVPYGDVALRVNENWVEDSILKTSWTSSTGDIVYFGVPGGYGGTGPSSATTQASLDYLGNFNTRGTISQSGSAVATQSYVSSSIASIPSLTFSNPLLRTGNAISLLKDSTLLINTTTGTLGVDTSTIATQSFVSSSIASIPPLTFSNPLLRTGNAISLLKDSTLLINTSTGTLGVDTTTIATRSWVSLNSQIPITASSPLVLSTSGGLSLTLDNSTIVVASNQLAVNQNLGLTSLALSAGPLFISPSWEVAAGSTNFSINTCNSYTYQATPLIIDHSTGSMTTSAMINMAGQLVADRTWVSNNFSLSFSSPLVKDTSTSTVSVGYDNSTILASSNQLKVNPALTLTSLTTGQISSTGGVTISDNQNNNFFGTPLTFYKSKNNAAIGSGSELGYLEFRAADAANASQRAGLIICQANGSPGTGFVPAYMSFFVEPSIGGSMVESLKLDENGAYTFGNLLATQSWANGVFQPLVSVTNPISLSGSTIGLKYDNSTITLNGSNQIRVNPNLSLTGLTTTGDASVLGSLTANTLSCTSASFGSVTIGGSACATTSYVNNYLSFSQPLIKNTSNAVSLSYNSTLTLSGSSLQVNPALQVTSLGCGTAPTARILDLYNPSTYSGFGRIRLNNAVEAAVLELLQGSTYTYLFTSTDHKSYFYNGGSNAVVLCADESNTANGNVGIRKNNPSYPLDVHGNANFDSNVTITGSLKAGNFNNQFDNRQAKPSDFAAGTVSCGFGQYSNDGSSGDFADVVSFNNWSDSSGGSQNMLMVRKGSIGMRVFQGSFGSTSTFSNYRDVLLADTSGAIAGPSSLGTGMFYWTPTITKGSVNFTGSTISAQFIKIFPKVIYIWFSWTYTSCDVQDTSNPLQITLPYAAADYNMDFIGTCGQNGSTRVKVICLAGSSTATVYWLSNYSSVAYQTTLGGDQVNFSGMFVAQ